MMGSCMHRERLQLSRDLHELSMKRLEIAGPGLRGAAEPMQQISAWQDKLRRDLMVGCTVWLTLPLPHTLDISHDPESCKGNSSWLEQ